MAENDSPRSRREKASLSIWAPVRRWGSLGARSRSDREVRLRFEPFLLGNANLDRLRPLLALLDLELDMLTLI